MNADAASLSLDAIDLADPERYRHGFPHAELTAIRRQQPIWWHPDTPYCDVIGGGGFWVVADHEHVQSISRDHERFRSLEGPNLKGDEPRWRNARIISMDPPVHTRHRRLVSAGFTPRMVAKLDEQARVWARRIIEHALEVGECNFVHEVAFQLPLHMIGDIVGIPVSDRAWVFEQLDVTLQSTDPQSPFTEEERIDAQVSIYEYGRNLAAEKRANPVDDVWSTLTTAVVQHDDGTTVGLSEHELDLFFIVLAAAGSETTRKAIAGGLLALDRNRDQWDLLRREPGLMGSAVEEILRWTSPLSYFRRTATEDVTIGDVTIAEGDRVSVWYPSANHDEAVYADPFRFDVTRSPNPQTAFGGGGIHYCLGANLAKREIKVLFEEMIDLVGEFELLGEPEYTVHGVQNPIIFSMRELPVRLRAR